MPKSLSDLARKVGEDLFGHPTGRKPLVELPCKVHKNLFGKPKQK